MDFTPELTAFQGVILSADNVHSFSKLTSKGGNEEKIDYVINNILKFLLNENYVVNKTIVKEQKYVMRKFALYIVLNADISVLEEMTDMEGLHMVIWTIPTIPKFLLSELLWNLYMEEFVYEIIAFCCPQLALEVMNALIDNIKYLTPFKCLEKLKIILIACYRLVSRLHFFNFENKLLSNLLTSIHENFQKCLIYFTNPPNAGKLIALQNDEQYRFKGNCLYTILNVIDKCIELYNTSQQFAPSDFHEIYILTFKVDELAANSCSNSSRSKDVLECLDKCHIALLDKSKDVVMDISVDIFCAWSEFEENDKSMQQTIGELCYIVRHKLSTINNLCEHPLINMIQQIECKPVSVEDMINVTDAYTIIENIKNNKDRDMWVHALLHRDKLCFDRALLQTLTSSLAVFNEEECHYLYRICQAYTTDHSENVKEVESLAVKAFQKCNSTTKMEILDQRFCNNNFFDMKELSVINDMMTEIFNKLIASPTEDISDILTVFIQSPQMVYTKLFIMAVDNNKQVEIMSTAMALLKNFANHYYNNETEPCLIRIAQNVIDNHLDTDTKEFCFVNFLRGLKNTDIISGTKLLLLIVMPNLYSALLRNDNGVINVQCQLLTKVYTLQELQEYRAPLLAMLAQVLKVVRWKMNTFIPQGPSTLQLVLQLQINLFNTYGDEMPDKEVKWLRSKLKYMQPLNSYYYRKLWNITNSRFIDVVSGLPVHKEMDLSGLGAWLSLMLCSCTKDEWYMIWENLEIFGETKTFDIICKVLGVITELQSKNHDVNTWGCLLHCYRNFVFIIRYKFFKEPLSDDKVLAVLNATASLANQIQEQNIEDFGTTLLPLFAYMRERRHDYTCNVPNSINLKHSKLTDMLTKE